MAKHSKKPDQPEAAETIRLADVLTFLSVYREVRNTSEQNLSNLLANHETKLGPPSTVLGQLKRIGKHFFGPTDGDDLGRLFDKEGGVLRPTADARRMHRRFLILRDVYERLKPDVLGSLHDKQSIIRIGATQSTGLRLLSTVFSDWERTFGKQGRQPLGRLRVEILSSSDLIARLNAGLLDFVIAYGVESSPPTFELGTDVVFRSLGYLSRLVLLCHPAAALWVHGAKGKVDANKGYWKKAYGNGHMPDINELREVQLDRIDFTDTDLIVVPIWRQPDALRSLAGTLPHDRVVEVPWYDEALALVRMGQGVTLAAETFATRERITAFRPLPQDEFARWVGVYYRGREGLTPQACVLVTFIKEYMEKFGTAMHAGRSPAFGHPDFETFCETFDMSRDWNAIAESDYSPIAPAKD